VASPRDVTGPVKAGFNHFRCSTIQFSLVTSHSGTLPSGGTMRHRRTRTPAIHGEERRRVFRNPFACITFQNKKCGVAGERPVATDQLDGGGQTALSTKIRATT